MKCASKGNGEFSDLINEEIINNLNSLSDSKYRDFQIKLIPGTTSDQMIGVRTPDLRSYAKELSKRDDISDFLNNRKSYCFINYLIVNILSFNFGSINHNCNIKRTICS